MRSLILLALVAAAVAVPRNPQRIVGGEATTVEEYPYMASMQYGWFGILWSQSCGGSLITTAFVLSAAHCYYGDVPSEWRVRLGTSLPNSGGAQHAVAQLLLHHAYNDDTLVNDVALIRLSNLATLSNSVNVASIAGPNYILPDDTTLTTIGYGTLSSGGPAASQLQHVDVNVINQELCAERYAYLTTQPGYGGWPTVDDGMICVGILNVGGADACQGDSGGPLAHNRNVLVGIVSWGFSCADAFYPGVNARVSNYSNWIVNSTLLSAQA